MGKPADSIAVMAAAISALFAGVTSWQAQKAAQLPFESALYSARINAATEFRRAFNRYDNVIRFALLDLETHVDTPEALAQATDDQMRLNAAVARKVMEARAEYVTEQNALMGLLRPSTQSAIAAAGDAETDATFCFLILGAHPHMPSADYWKDVRRTAAEPCRGINDHSKLKAWQAKTDVALAVVDAELRESQNDLTPR